MRLVLTIAKGVVGWALVLLSSPWIITHVLLDLGGDTEKARAVIERSPIWLWLDYLEGRR